MMLSGALTTRLAGLPAVPPFLTFVRRPLHASASLAGFRDKFVSERDLNKRPSQLEIQKKGLPVNTPTLGERLKRDYEHAFHANDPQGGYHKGPTGTWRDHVTDMSLKEIVTEGFEEMTHQVRLIKESFTYDPANHIPRPGDTHVFWKFDEDKDFDRWATTADSDWGEGYSTCELAQSPNGKAIFRGELNTRPPQDGRIHQAGYCNVGTLKEREAFYRLRDFMMYHYTDLVLRVRGDGRMYSVNIHVHGEFDIMWNDLWSFPLYTRGGPYWQEVTIPFSKFMMSHKGYLQDRQESVNLMRFTGVSITLRDRVDGPFSLEIDHVSAHLRDNLQNVEELAYESYILPSKGFTQGL